MRLSRVMAMVLLAAGVTVAVLAGCQPAAPSYPTKPIEFVVHSSPGGGADLLARMISDVVAKDKIVPVAMPVVNKTGGSGAVAYSYVAEKKADPYTIAHVSPIFLTTPLAGNAPVTYKDFTIICRLLFDEEVVSVKYDSPYKTLQDLVDAAKKNPKGIKQGGGSAGGSDTMVSYSIEKATGAKFSFISFNSGADAMAQLLGGNVDFIVGEPAEAMAQSEAKKTRVLAADAKTRLPGLPDVKTLIELGINADFEQWRGIVAPKGIPEDARNYLESTFEKITKTQGFLDYVKKQQMTLAFAKGTDFAKQLEADNEAYKEPLKGQGLMK